MNLYWKSSNDLNHLTSFLKQKKKEVIWYDFSIILCFIYLTKPKMSFKFEIFLILIGTIYFFPLKEQRFFIINNLFFIF